VTLGVFTPYAAFVTAKDVFGDKTEDITACVKEAFNITFHFSNGVQGANLS
jgi:hypothetical protein